MTLKQLLQTNSWLSVSSILLELYPDEDKNMEGYESVFEKMLMMTPEETDMAIVIKTVKDDFDGLEYVDISGRYNHPKNGEEEFLQAIEFTPWKQWLGMEISAESFKYFSELEIIAHCLFEITFVGFEEEEIEEEWNGLERTVGDYLILTEEERREKMVFLDDILEGLDKDDDEEENENT